MKRKARPGNGVTATPGAPRTAAGPIRWCAVHRAHTLGPDGWCRLGGYHIAGPRLEWVQGVWVEREIPTRLTPAEWARLRVELAALAPNLFGHDDGLPEGSPDGRLPQGGAPPLASGPSPDCGRDRPP